MKISSLTPKHNLFVELFK